MLDFSSAPSGGLDFPAATSILGAMPGETGALELEVVGGNFCKLKQHRGETKNLMNLVIQL